MKTFVVVGMLIGMLTTFAAPSEAAETYATRATARQHAGCQRIETAALAAGLAPSVAARFAYRIAPRESGCVMQCVHDRDDWGCSVVGNNAGGHGQWASGWKAWCGIDVRKLHTVEQDMVCAAAAYRHRGWKPWATG